MVRTARYKGRCEPLRRGFINSPITRTGRKAVSRNYRLAALIAALAVCVNAVRVAADPIGAVADSNFSISVSGGEFPIIVGTTKFPDGTVLLVYLKKPWLPDGAQRIAHGLPACGN